MTISTKKKKKNPVYKMKKRWIKMNSNIFVILIVWLYDLVKDHTIRDYN